MGGDIWPLIRSDYYRVMNVTECRMLARNRLLLIDENLTFRLTMPSPIVCTPSHSRPSKKSGVPGVRCFRTWRDAGSPPYLPIAARCGETRRRSQGRNGCFPGASDFFNGLIGHHHACRDHSKFTRMCRHSLCDEARRSSGLARSEYEPRRRFIRGVHELRGPSFPCSGVCLHRGGYCLGVRPGGASMVGACGAVSPEDEGARPGTSGGSIGADGARRTEFRLALSGAWATPSDRS